MGDPGIETGLSSTEVSTCPISIVAARLLPVCIKGLGTICKFGPFVY